MPTAPGETLRLDNGRRVGFLARGPDDGQPVVWVHGWPGCRLEQLIVPDAVLRRHGVRLIAVDRPGYGRTDPLAGTRAERMADVLGVCDALGVGVFPAIGVSCGGSNVVALAASARDRVTRVVLSSAQMPYDDESALTGLDPEQLKELPAARLGRTPELLEDEEQYRQRLLDAGAAPLLEDANFSAEEWSWLGDDRVKIALEADVHEAVRASAEGLTEDFLMSVKPFEFDLSDVKCPVYAVHGSADDWEPLANLRRILAQLAHTELILLDGLGHLGPLLDPDRLLSLAMGGDDSGHDA